MPDSSFGKRDEDFHAPAPVADPLLSDLAERIRTHLQADGSALELIDDIRLFILARFYQIAPVSIADELVSWGMDAEYADELVQSVLKTSRYHPRAELARRIAEADSTGPVVDSALAAITRPRPSDHTFPGNGTVVIPQICPTCNRAFHTVEHLRPMPALGWPARLLLLGGSVLSALLFLIALVVLRAEFQIPPFRIAIVCFPIALLPALGIGLLAYQLPRVVRLNCRGCGWQAKITIPHRSS